MEPRCKRASLWSKKHGSRLLLLALLPAVLGRPDAADAGYKVLFKSGEERFVDDYWLDQIDKTVIRLLSNNAMERVPREGVRYISPQDNYQRGPKTIIKRITFQQKPGLAPYLSEITRGREEGTPAPAEAVAKSPFQAEAETLVQERENAKNGYREALTTGDMTQREEFWGKIQAVSEQITVLRERVKVDNLGELPDWWRW